MDVDMNEQIHIVLDWMYDGENASSPEELEAWLRELVEVYPVNVEMLKSSGPTGWPLVKVVGIRRQVRGFLLAEYMGGEVAGLNSIATLVEDYEGEL